MVFLSLLNKALILCLFLSTMVQAAPARTLWLSEQFGLGTEPTAFRLPRSQLGIDLASYGDATSTQAAVQADLGIVEVKVFGSKRVLFEITDRGKTLAGQYAPHSVGFEIGRFYSNEEGRYGRLALGYIDQLGKGNGIVKIVLDTGVLPLKEPLWCLRLHSAVLVELPKGQQTFVVNADVSRASAPAGKNGWELGGSIGFDYRPGVSEALGTYEHLLLTMGPSLRYESDLGMMAVRANWRLWMDRENLLSGTTNVKLTASEISPVPDLLINWTLSF